MKDLTIREAQQGQPWTVPYSPGVEKARADVPHILGSHVALHAAKSVGKLAAVFEAADHKDGPLSGPAQVIISEMAADLVTAALRLANLYGFDLESALRNRVEEKNGVGFALAARADADAGQAVTVKDKRPPAHAKYLVRRDGYLFTATPCYGLHHPWWVVKTMDGEAEPAGMKDTDTWQPLPPPPTAAGDAKCDECKGEGSIPTGTFPRASDVWTTCWKCGGTGKPAK